ncbi:MAG: hypothetical protein AAFY88_13695 [Acidobacteriota bacterium]
MKAQPPPRAPGLVPALTAVAWLLLALGSPPTSNAQAAGAQAETAGPAEDPVTLSFAFVGCNRVGWSEVDGQPLPPSTANEPQLLQTFTDITQIGADRGLAVSYLFLLGDIVRNEASAKTLAAQLSEWQQLYAGSDLAVGDTRMVPIVGNHEVLTSVEYADGEYYEVPQVGANAAWLRWLNAHGHPPQPGNGPTPDSSPTDLLRGDNSQLTYSFDVATADGKSVHFVLMNTDSDSTYSSAEPECYQPPRRGVSFHGHPVTGTAALDVPGWIAADWIAKDLAGAGESDYVFALGHKPITYPGSASYTDTSTGRDTIFNCGDQRRAEALVHSFDAHPSFVAYLTAHQHLWDAYEIKGPTRSFWQIVAGDGGSPLVSGSSFGFTLVDIHESGAVTATRYDRPVPASGYYSADGVGPATAGKTFVLNP